MQTNEAKKASFGDSFVFLWTLFSSFVTNYQNPAWIKRFLLISYNLIF